MILHRKVGQNDDKLYFLLATKNESLSHHSSRANLLCLA
jgi:hypothetical protein